MLHSTSYFHYQGVAVGGVNDGQIQASSASSLVAAPLHTSRKLHIAFALKKQLAAGRLRPLSFLLPVCPFRPSYSHTTFSPPPAHLHTLSLPLAYFFFRSLPLLIGAPRLPSLTLYRNILPVRSLLSHLVDLDRLPLLFIPYLRS